MASHFLIDRQLGELRRRLPAEAVDELADGLSETFDHHLARGLDPASAAATSIAEFGDQAQIAAAFARSAPGRRVAMALLATGPLLGACWAPVLVAGRAWTWPVPPAAAAVFWIALLAAIATLLAAATSRRSYRRTRLAAAGAGALVLLDLAMLVAVLLAAPFAVWPMAVAVPASLTRICLTIRALPGVLAG